MTAEVLGYSAKLKWFVNVSTLPPPTQKQCGRSHIFGERSLREASDFFQCISSHDVSGSCAPRHAEGVLDWLGYVYEEVQTLAQWVSRRYVVEKLKKVVSEITCRERLLVPT